jgi:hypothetical protein
MSGGEVSLAVCWLERERKGGLGEGGGGKSWQARSDKIRGLSHLLLHHQARTRVDPRGHVLPFDPQRRPSTPD